MESHFGNLMRFNKFAGFVENIATVESGDILGIAKEIYCKENEKIYSKDLPTFAWAIEVLQIPLQFIMTTVQHGKRIKGMKNPISLNGTLNLERCFEKMGNLEDSPRNDRPFLIVDHVHLVKSVIEDLAAET
ncbi:hypothetical protein CEXT_470941 [Caerostris extrusa]|uniref:Uncharacterized protein n=1 Tax=Caerostris extrusa TaxID=172846 RepID=A0AAV4XWF7_CAEEX|nr:hypothetical protein CEXT_470941 [Caerostris extrusa]